MRKSKIYTLFTFLLALCIIFGGWFMTVKILRQQEEKFLNSTGSIEVRMEETALLVDNDQGVEKEEEGQDEFRGQTMTEYTRALVLAVWEYGGNEVSHEPLPGQMNREQAIDAGKKWIENMAEYGVFTDELQECGFDMVKAGLFTLDTPLIVGNMDESMYSYWKLWFRKDGVSVELTIHADSGEVWMASISVESGDQPTETYDLVYLLEGAFPFIETGNISWVDMLNGEVSVSSLNGALTASVRRYTVWVKDQYEQSGCEVVEFNLHQKE